METDILIIGGGLAGLSLALQLEATGRDWQLLEARSRWGGRILTEVIESQGFDLGPSWFWPGQPRIAGLLKRFDLKRFDQAYEGDLIYQDETGQVHRGKGIASMRGSWRLQGGLAQLISRMVEDLPSSKLHLSSPVEQLHDLDSNIEVQIASGGKVNADQVVLALPPRVAMQLSFTPVLSERTVHAAQIIPTWMAGHAKAVAIYKNAFWIERDLSGDAMSRHGPLVEIHDASPAEGGPYALFGFVGMPVSDRIQNTEALVDAIHIQLGQLFGSEGLQTDALLLQDWATDAYTAIELDHAPPNHHPAYGRPEALTHLWNGRLHFGSTEMAVQYGGCLEGALEVADELASALTAKPRHNPQQQ